MDNRVIVLIVFACVFSSGLLGFFLGKVLPDRHLEADSRDIVKLATGLIATLSALVLGLLVSSAKGTFDEVRNELTQGAARGVVLDRVLAQYGPETNEIRARIKSYYTIVVERLTSDDESQLAKLDSPEFISQFERLQADMRALTPKNDEQRGLQSRAIQMSTEMSNTRWLLSIQRTGTISMPMLAVLVFWLCIIFAAWGVISPRNIVVATALLACALSVSGATLLILELNQPLSGWLRISPRPLEKAVDALGR